ncbi:MAG: phosphate signaling complex protein PhoU [Desulfovibrionaceae bacterium]|nr:phosphate signaling complex protein PhoU [Desulfovibrionaceae bacterium]MBF0514119.1 phosphate signaling complex protein PhoU [Desulfovibrionaceae bacterium]
MTFFHEQLGILRAKVLQMAAHAERAVENSFDSFLNKDQEMAQEVIERDQDINALEVEIDNVSLKLLALDQPMARDLRFIVGCMRLVIDLERIGDEAVNVAERTIFMSNLPTQAVSPLMEQLTAMVRDMFLKAIAAFREGDAELAAQVCRLDASVDEQHFKVVKNAMNVSACDNTIMERAIHRIMVAKAMERIADQATNIAETTIFIVKGVSVKHHCMPF